LHFKDVGIDSVDNLPPYTQKSAKGYNPLKTREMNKGCFNGDNNEQFTVQK
jgi:hypothetical protein